MTEEQKATADRLIFKSTSARFVMATITTAAACMLTAFICWKYPDAALTQSCVAQFYTIWAMIATYYFASRGVDKKS